MVSRRSPMKVSLIYSQSLSQHESILHYYNSILNDQNISNLLERPRVGDSASSSLLVLSCYLPNRSLLPCSPLCVIFTYHHICHNAFVKLDDPTQSQKTCLSLFALYMP